MTENVVLTGFMGTGKSAVGQLLASRLGFEWVDTDGLIESRHGPIVEIFASNGEEAFRDMEKAVAVELAGRVGLVISTGGRMMLDADNVAVLGKQSRVFCLTAAFDEIVRRVEAEDGPARPLLSGTRSRERISTLLEERAAAYAQFEQVATDDRSVDEVVDDLIDRLGVAG